MANSFLPDKKVSNPYTEENPPVCIPWGGDILREDGDALIPEGGFIKDFVHWTKGIEAPTEFAIWAALWLLSSFAKRDVWFRWQKEFPLFPNLYVILVAPPGILKKSTMIHRADWLGYTAPMTIMQDPYDLWTASKKLLSTHRGMITPQALHELLEPPMKYSMVHRNGDGRLHDKPIDRGSQLAIQVSELATFLSKASYSIGLVEKLTDLYDCKWVDDQYTKKEGSRKLSNIYVTFLGATTPDGMRMSIPKEAFGGGFMSRCIVVYSEKITRFYPRPFEPPSAPASDDMARRLGWVIGGSWGEYDLSPEANEAHEAWYRPFKLGLLQRSEAEMHILSRMDTVLLRLATLVRMQRYERGNIITLEDYRAAKSLLTSTLRQSTEVYEDASGGEKGEALSRTRKVLRRQKSTTWKRLQSSLSRYVNSEELEESLQTLYDMGFLKIVRNNQEIHHPSHKPDTVYLWLGGDNDEG